MTDTAIGAGAPTDQAPKPTVGQVWADNDWRSAGRTVRIDLIKGEYAYVTTLTNTSSTQDDFDNGRALWRRDMRGRQSRILLARLRPTSTGYRYLRTEGGDFDA
jgi:hypothetical protein